MPCAARSSRARSRSSPPPEPTSWRVRIPHITSKEVKDMKKRTTYMGVLLAVVGALVIAGCGGGSTSTTPESGTAENASASTGSEAGSGGGTISGAEVSSLGSVLVDSEGMTVYLFTPDKGT